MFSTFKIPSRYHFDVCPQVMYQSSSIYREYWKPPQKQDYWTLQKKNLFFGVRCAHLRALFRCGRCFEKLNVRKILPQQLLHNGMLAWLLLVTGLFVVLPSFFNHTFFSGRLKDSARGQVLGVEKRKKNKWKFSAKVQHTLDSLVELKRLSK